MVAVIGHQQDRATIGPRASWLYMVGRAAVRLVLVLGARVQVKGRERIPRRGALLVIANHSSVLDPVVLAASFPRPVMFMAKDELFHVPIFGRLLRAAGIIPVRRGRPDRAALEEALAVLRQGGVLALFPEGTRSPDGVLQTAHAGAGLLAVRSAAPVLPVAIIGTERLRRARSWLIRPRIALRVGELVLGPLAAERGRDYRPLAGRLMERVAALLPTARRGAYAQSPSGLPASGAHVKSNGA